MEHILVSPDLKTKVYFIPHFGDKVQIMIDGKCTMCHISTARDRYQSLLKQGYMVVLKSKGFKSVV